MLTLLSPTLPAGQTAVACCLVALTAVALLRSLLSRNRLPYPPGPPAEFLLGHLRVVPKENTAQTYARWSKQYDSDVIYVKTLGQPIVVLNSAQAAKDLLDKRGGNYCDRPRFTLFEVMGWGMTLTFLPFGPKWQMHRKLLQTTFSNSNVRQWHDLQLQEARRTISYMLARPDEWEQSLRRFAVAVVLKVSYGVDVLQDDDPYIQIANDAMHATGNGGVPANSIVDMFPPARHLPNWLARDWPLKFARDWGWAIRKLHDAPFAEARKAMDEGLENNSFAHSLLDRYDSNEKQGLRQEWTLEDIKGAAGAIFIAGADTTWATLVIFILNMILHPDIQAKAQALLDSVVGSERLPDFSDRSSLPLIDFIVQETYRWSPLAPLGIPHKSLKDDIYKDKLIPKGSIVFANSHAMTQDERLYNNPQAFDPERYRPKAEGGREEPYPVGQFGFGRRICIGRFLADNSVWILAATMLAVFDIGKKIDENGNVIEPEVRFTNGGTCHPEHFECSLRPRSKKAAQLLTAALAR